MTPVEVKGGLLGIGAAGFLFAVVGTALHEAYLRGYGWGGMTSAAVIWALVSWRGRHR